MAECGQTLWLHTSVQFKPVGRRNTMTPILTILFYIGMNLSPIAPVQEEIMPQPTLWAEPGSVITWGKPVTIVCQGIVGAQQYYLDKVGCTPPMCRQTLLEPGTTTKFPIQATTELHAGQYQCYYETLDGYSKHSATLELVVTGVYSKPKLSALPSSVVTLGMNVSLKCVSWLGFGSFLLTKEGANKPSWTQDAQRHPNGHMQALFTMGPVMPGHRWKFRCYGCDKNNAQVCSVPSDPLELTISGIDDTTSPSLNMSDPSTDSSLQDQTVENLIRITMAGLVLVTLGILLFEAQHSQRKSSDAAGR